MNKPTANDLVNKGYLLRPCYIDNVPKRVHSMMNRTNTKETFTADNGSKWEAMKVNGKIVLVEYPSGGSPVTHDGYTFPYNFLD